MIKRMLLKLRLKLDQCLSLLTPQKQKTLTDLMEETLISLEICTVLPQSFSIRYFCFSFVFVMNAFLTTRRFMKTGVVSQAAGSAYIELNNTKVICAVYGPRQKAKMEVSEEGKLSCEFRWRQTCGLNADLFTKVV